MLVVMLSVLVIMETVLATSQVTTFPSCPRDCTCDQLGLSVRVDCSARPSVKGSDDSSLEVEINDYLISVGTVLQLRIQNTSLSELPSEVCNKVELTHLLLDRNRLTALPDGCISHMSQLVTFTAMYNKITFLQVSIAQ